MEVVCFILGPTSTSQPCSHNFWVLMSLSFLLKMFFIILVDIAIKMDILHVYSEWIDELIVENNWYKSRRVSKNKENKIYEKKVSL